MIYSSIDNSKIKDLKKLHIKKYRDKNNLFLVEGEHLVIEAYKAGYLDELVLEETENFSLDIKTSYVTKTVINYLSLLETPSNIIGVCHKKEGILTGNKIIILDEIQDPGNLGTIIRSSLAFNLDTLIVSNCVDIYNPKTIRATQGALFHTNILTSSILDITETLKSEDFRIYGTDLKSGKDLRSIEINKKSVIIMGNEGSGLSSLSKKICDEFIYIKMNDNCESLNVAVATSIILYEFNSR